MNLELDRRVELAAEGFPDRMRQARGGLTQRAFACDHALTHAAVAQWERGNNYPNTKILIRLAFAHDIDLHWLLTGERR